MVLDASPSSDLDNAFPNSPDFYESDPQPSLNLMNIDRDQLPKPLPILGPLFGYSEPKMTEVAAQRIQYYVSMVGRPTTRQESEAVMFHTFKAMAISSYGGPIALGAGLWRAYRTRESYRIPFYGPMKDANGWFNGERLRIMGNEFPMTPSRRAGIHFIRGTLYGSLSYIVGSLFIASYSTTVAVVGEMRDPRLKALVQAKRMEERKGTQQREQVETKPGPRDPGLQMGQVGATGPVGGARQPQDPMGQGNVTAAELWKRHRKGIGAQDDASPSADTDFFGGDVDSQGGSNTGLMSDSQMRAQEARQQASPSESPTESRASTFRVEKVERQPSSFGDDFDDDASPTRQSNAGDGQGGNAWDRIRRQAQQQASEQKSGGGGWEAIRKQQEVGSTAGDSFTFSSAAQERQLAKHEAQKEFDARVERERQGGGFNEDTGRKW
ncbi:MAG: hypothetical protein LQ346_003852 [Caloplaca aetnensis]|nr:MAG: hypothetical protein LQ346_003852 [Caloplaca aetnensis]